MNGSRLLYAVEVGDEEFGEILKFLGEDYQIESQDGTECIVQDGERRIRLEVDQRENHSWLIVSIGTNSFTPEGVGAAWNLFVSVYCQNPGRVWLGTYDHDYLRQFGGVTDYEIQSVHGFVLNPEVFEKMIS